MSFTLYVVTSSNQRLTLVWFGRYLGTAIVSLVCSQHSSDILAIRIDSFYLGALVVTALTLASVIGIIRQLTVHILGTNHDHIIYLSICHIP